MKKETIGVVILATNAYFVLGVRFIRRWMHFYKGERNVKFYFFSDTNPEKHLPSDADYEFYHTQHNNWVDGTNSKFKNILKLSVVDADYLYYFDADTNIQKDFTEDWMLGDLVGGEHYNARTILCCGKGFDRNPKGNSYVPGNSPHPYVYHYGAFFGGEREKLMDMMSTLAEWQRMDQRINYEPPVNDESYINKYFHYEDHKIVKIEDFAFVVSDKGGLGNTRQMNMNVEEHKKNISLNRDQLWDLQYNKLVYGK